MKTRKVTMDDFYKMLKSGKVTFQYTKKDGSVRTAVGTLNDSFITKGSKGGENKTKGAGYTTYFDVEKNAFRCFAESKMIGIVEA